MACSILPDLDSVGLLLGIPYEHVLGHRGLTHSLPFAAVVAWTVVRGLFPHTAGFFRYQLYLYFFLCTASHGLLDAMTDGGLGVAFFAPFHNDRYFAPFRPIVVSPLEPSHFFSRRALGILRSEFVWVGLPSLGLAILAQVWRSAMGRDRPQQRG
jgi:inner membrane protein